MVINREKLRGIFRQAKAQNELLRQWKKEGSMTSQTLTAIISKFVTQNA